MKMKLKKRADGDRMLSIRYDTGGGEMVASVMPAAAVLEMINRSEKVETVSEKGYELVCEGRWHFPSAPFEDAEKGEGPGLSRMSKGEMVEEASSEMTVPELKEALGKARKSPEHGRAPKPKAEEPAAEPGAE